MPRALVSLSSLALVFAAACGGEQTERHPDVLFLVVDTLRADHLGCYGYERPTSPVIDSLAEGGTVLTRTSSQAPWTLPSMSSMITSRYFTAHRDFPEAESPTLAETFQAGGYHTIGVVGNTLLEPQLGFGRGFDEYLVTPGDFPKLLDHLRDPLDAAVEDDERAPLFLYFHAFDPHAPYVAHPEYDEVLPLGAAPAIAPEGWQEEMLKTHGPQPPADDPEWARALAQLDRRRALYDQEVRFADEHVGVLLQMLEERGVSDDLLIVLVSDHGEGLWEHLSPAPAERLIAFPPDHLFFGGHGHDLSEQALRTPFVLRGPGVPAGARFDEPVENIDLFPTLLSLCALPRPGGLHGVDLAPLFAGDVSAGAWREESYAYIRQFACIRDEAAQLKLVVPTEYGVEKGMRGPTLHHLDQDLRERRDLTSERPEDVSRLTARLEAHLERYPTTTQRVGDRISQQKLEALGYAGQGNDDEED
jgi:arylsulfatase A-like enzyme